MRDWVLDQACSNARTRRDNDLETAIMYHKVTNFAAEALLNGAPERFATMMAVGEFVERLLQEAVTVRGGRLLGGAGHRRHVAHARFSP